MRKLMIAGAAALSLVALAGTPIVSSPAHALRADAEGSGADVQANRRFAQVENRDATVHVVVLAYVPPTDSGSG